MRYWSRIAAFSLVLVFPWRNGYAYGGQDYGPRAGPVYTLLTMPSENIRPEAITRLFGKHLGLERPGLYSYQDDAGMAVQLDVPSVRTESFDGYLSMRWKNDISGSCINLDTLETQLQQRGWNAETGGQRAFQKLVKPFSLAFLYRDSMTLHNCMTGFSYYFMKGR